MIEEQHVTFETAKLAKEKGFEEPCNDFYDNLLDEEGEYSTFKHYCKKELTEDSILIPTQSILARWFRENTI